MVIIMKEIFCAVLLSGLSIVVYAQQTDTAKAPDYAPVEAKPAVPWSEKVFSSVEQFPEFPGGAQGLTQYLMLNLRYPTEAQKKNIQGKVFIKFVVCQDGSLCNEEVVKGIGGGCDEEVIRVIKAMPKWKPGKQNGKPVKVYYTLPVSFKFEEKQEKK